MQESFPDAVVGLSDHSVDNLACIGAVASGAAILERHFTDSKTRSGPDIACSMDPEECRDLIHSARRLKRMTGGQKGPVPEEGATIRFAYASVVSIRPIEKEEILSEANIWVKRPGTGQFKAEDYYRLLGKRAARRIEEGAQLTSDDILE
jgi:N-acetylneuraminate synthase